jgi:hypothetical protein
MERSSLAGAGLNSIPFLSKSMYEKSRKITKMAYTYVFPQNRRIRAG